VTDEPRKTYAELQGMAVEFLKSHMLGVLATGRRDGSPQQSIIAYSFDGDDVVVRTGSDTAKIKNLRRHQGVSLAVTEGPACVVVYGAARLLQGEDAEAFLGEAPSSGRQRGIPTLIVFTPETYRWARLEG
jgi:nitroimidazol reductase NimA-like FMN-containing flavoprotein (pyridoxamine 5'-phosphate oxidase superfamily)